MGPAGAVMLRLVVAALVLLALQALWPARSRGVDRPVASTASDRLVVVAFGLVSYAMSFGRPLRWYARLLILLAVPLVAIGCNVLRLIPTVWVYSRGDGSSAQRFHDIAGWVTLALAWVMLLALLAALRWAMVPIRWFQLASA